MLICSPLSALEVEAFYSSYRHITSDYNRIGQSYRIIGLMQSYFLAIPLNKQHLNYGDVGESTKVHCQNQILKL